MTYGQVIYELRKNRHMTQGDGSRGITSQVTFSRFEKGEAYVSAENLFKYLQRLRVHPTEFFLRLRKMPVLMIIIIFTKYICQRWPIYPVVMR